MKIKTTCANIVLALTIATSLSSIALADGNPFTPLNFDDTNYSAPAATPKTATPKATNPVTKAVSKIMPDKGAAPKDAVGALNGAPGEVPIGNDNIQNAILELDNAQVGIRNDLLNYKAKYADVDAQFKLIKNERSMLAKQVRQIEGRIKNIDRAKEKIRRNML